MHRVAIQAFRTVRLLPLRKLGRGNLLPLLTSGYALGAQSVSTSSRKIPISISPMRFRRLSIALASTVVGTGAWYMYKSREGVSGSSNVPQSRSLSSSIEAVSHTTLDPAEQTRLALVVDIDRF